MKYQRGHVDWELVGFILIPVAPLALLIGGTILLDAATCHSKARAMGFNSTWGPLQGCMVEYSPGQYWPLDSVRIINGRIVLGGEDGT